MAFLYKDANIKKNNGQSPDIQLHFISAHQYTEGDKEHAPFNFDNEVRNIILHLQNTGQTCHNFVRRCFQKLFTINTVNWDILDVVISCFICRLA